MRLAPRLLHCHPRTPCAEQIDIVARVRCVHPMELEIEYRLRGELDRLRIAAPATPRRADRLWQHTCFEAFVAVPDDAGYLEWNLSPSGQWAAYAFCAYRDGMADPGVGAPGTTVQREADSLVVIAALPLGDWLQDRRPRELDIGLNAVIESRQGDLSYWALAHRPEKPDFHDRATFALQLRTA